MPGEDQTVGGVRLTAHGLGGDLPGPFEDHPLLDGAGPDLPFSLERQVPRRRLLRERGVGAQQVPGGVGAALVGIVTFGSLTGSMLPFILQRLGFDPASASAPFVATLVDVTGLVIYFTIALLFLRGTLL